VAGGFVGICMVFALFDDLHSLAPTSRNLHKWPILCVVYLKAAKFQSLQESGQMDFKFPIYPKLHQ